jgi:hypothetical protein
MPSIQQTADQINAKLDQINNNTAATVAVGNGIRSDLHAGFSVLSTGLFAIWELQKVANSFLEHHTKQNDTIICLLENTNELLCGVTRKLTRQLDLGEGQLKSVKRLEGIAERTEAEAAGDFDRMADVQKSILQCCPADEVKPEPCPESCPVPKVQPHGPKGQDWQPLPPRQPPVG